MLSSDAIDRRFARCQAFLELFSARAPTKPFNCRGKTSYTGDNTLSPSAFRLYSLDTIPSISCNFLFQANALMVPKDPVVRCYYSQFLLPPHLILLLLVSFFFSSCLWAPVLHFSLKTSRDYPRVSRNRHPLHSR